jgi:hypothetical protein
MVFYYLMSRGIFAGLMAYGYAHYESEIWIWAGLVALVPFLGEIVMIGFLVFTMFFLLGSFA